MALRLLADDLTGALDSAAQFCGAAGNVHVVPRPTTVLDVPAGRALAVNLACRDGSEDAARQASARHAPVLLTGEPAFKKIDSLLRGHWAAELAPTLVAGFASCVLAPAFPAQGRTTRGGRLYAPTPVGTFAPVGPPLRDRLVAAGLAVATGEAGSAESGPPPVHVLDAETMDDLARIVAWGRRLPGPVLWCGSAGLAAALAGAEPPLLAQVPVAKAALLVVGSDHPVTSRQFSTVLKRHGLPHFALGQNVGADASNIRLMAREGSVAVSVAIPQPSDRAAAAGLIAARLSALLPRLDPPKALVVVGGETLLAVCDALAVASLEVVGEYAPGIPVSVLAGGPWAGTRLYSKSGAFGEADLLARMLFG